MEITYFQDTVRKIEKGLISEEEINRQFMAYWWNPRLYPQEKAFLEQTPIYSFGNELFGSIYDAFGLDVMFQCFFQPGKALLRNESPLILLYLLFQCRPRTDSSAAPVYICLLW